MQDIVIISVKLAHFTLHVACAFSVLFYFITFHCCIIMFLFFQQFKSLNVQLLVAKLKGSKTYKLLITRDVKVLEVIVGVLSIIILVSYHAIFIAINIFLYDSRIFSCPDSSGRLSNWKFSGIAVLWEIVIIAYVMI